MSWMIVPRPLTAADFAPYGDVIDCNGAPDRIINQGMCGRYHDRAALDAGGGRLGLSLFCAELRRLPMSLEMVERHPLGAQCFIPMSMDGFLVVVCPDEEGTPGVPLAFLSAPGQAVNLHRGTWHGVLTPLAGPGLFAVIDRVAPDDAGNLEEHWFEAAFVVDAPAR